MRTDFEYINKISKRNDFEKILAFKSYFSKIITSGITLIAASILSGIGTDSWTFIKNVLTNSSLFSSINVWQIISYVLGIFGIILLVSALLQNKSDKRLHISKEDYKNKVFSSLEPNTNESKLDQDLSEIEFCIERWNRRAFMKNGYRREIEIKTIWKNVPKIREHSQKIKKKLKLLRNAHSRDHVTWQSVDEIADRIAKLGVDVESVFQYKLVKEINKTPQDKINKLLSDGDSICDDLKSIILKLEKLRGTLD